MPVAFARGDDHRVTGVEVLDDAPLLLNAHATLDDEEPLGTGVSMPVRSRTVRECHAVHAYWNAGLIVGQTLDRCTAEERSRINRAGRRLT